MKSETDTQVDQLECEVGELKQKIAELRLQRPREEVSDYRFRDWENRDVTLSELFGAHDRLILVHNMGKECKYCTMWADGFNGLTPHLNSQTSFVVTSPNSPGDQKKFAEPRGWQFRMLSAETGFINDMGFVDSDEGMMPGASVFVREQDGTIYRVGRVEFGPHDDYCAVWHFLDLFPGGVEGWEPQESYQATGVKSCCAANGSQTGNGN